MNENDLQNVCGGTTCKNVASALIAAGTILVACGTAVYAVLNGGLKIEPILTACIPIKKTTVTEETTYSYYRFC